MKIAIIDTYYSEFLKNFRDLNPRMINLPYIKQKNELLKTFFGTSDFFSCNLKRLGHKVTDFIVNDETLQKTWAKENSLQVKDNWLISKIQMLPYMYRFLGKAEWIQKIALEQIKQCNPDIVYVQDLSIFNPETLKEIKKYCQLLVGQIACPLPPERNLKEFNLIITSFPHYVNLFRRMGIESKYQKLAFEPRVLKRVGKQKRIYDVVFVGSFTLQHQKGTQILEKVAKNIPIHIWGQGLQFLSPGSPLRKDYHGPAWGIDMYRILAKSKIVLNRHIGVSGLYANNMRLYEATGMGAMLITDNKINLNDLFNVGKEVVAYEDEKDLISKISYYLKHDKERSEIANAGQRRTIREHAYPIRMKELVSILNKYI